MKISGLNISLLKPCENGNPLLPPGLSSIESEEITFLVTADMVRVGRMPEKFTLTRTSINYF